MDNDKLIKGTLFSEYVRMIKSSRDLPWDQYLTDEDFKLIEDRILASGWYPLDAYKRMGLAVFKLIAKSNVDAAWNWGRASMEGITKIYKNLLAVDTPGDAARRFCIIQRNVLNFEFLEVENVEPGTVKIHFLVKFGDEADHAYAYHFGGMLERLLELTSDSPEHLIILDKAWEGAEHTVFEMKWNV